MLSAVGWKGRPFYYYGGLTEKELPKGTCPKGYVLMKIEGLSGLPSTNPFNKEHGYFFFSRKEPGMDVKRYAIFKKLIIYELLKVACQKYDGIAPDESLPENTFKCYL